MNSRRPFHPILACRIALAAVLAFSASAAAQTWTAAVNTNWNNAGNWNPATIPNSATADVILGFTGAGIVNIASSVQARSLTFDSVSGGAYTLTSSAGQTLSNLADINVNGPTVNVQTINLANVAGGSLVFPGTGPAALAISNNADPSASPTLAIGPNTVIGTAGSGGITIGGTGHTVVSGSFSATQPVTGGLTKAGPGVLVLSGNGTNFGGGLSLNDGTVRLDFTSNTAVKLANTGNLFSLGGDIDLVAHATTAVTQNNSGTLLAGGHTQINRSGGAAAVNFGMGGISRLGATTFDVANTGGPLTVSTSAGTTNSLLGVGAAFATVNGLAWASVSGGNIVGIPGTAGVFGAGVNTLISANTSTPAVTTNSLRFDAGSPTLTLTGTLTLTSGGILTASTASSPTISLGPGGGIAVPGELLIHQYSNDTLTIGAPISAPAGLTKTGPGLLSLGGVVTTGGLINIHRGGLQITSISAVNSSAGINFNDNRTGGNLQQFIVDVPNGGGTISRPIRLSAHSVGINSANVFSTGASLNTVVTLSGVISSAPGSVTPIRFTGALDDSSSFRLTGTNTFTGDVWLTNGTLGVFSNASLGNAANTLVLLVGSATAGGLQFLNDNGLDRSISLASATRIICNADVFATNSGPVTGATLVKAGNGTLLLTNAGNAGTRDIQAGTLAFNAAGLGTAGNFQISDNATLAITATAILDVSRSVTFGSTLVPSIGTGFTRGMIDVAVGQTFSIPGFVSEFINGDPGTLIKTGPGVLNLTGTNNNYSGGTVVRAGELRVLSNSNLGQALGPVTVEPLGTLTFTTTMTTSRTFSLFSGTVVVAAGQTLTFNNNATVAGGFLRGAGSFALTGGTALSGVTTLTSTTISQTGPASVANFTNGGSFTVGAGQTLAWNGGTNTSSGRMFVNGTANVSDFVSNGQVTIPNGGVMNNSGAPLLLGGGSRTFIGSAAAPGGAINLGGQTLELNGGLLVNNGTVSGTVNVNFGSVAKGAGQYGVVNVGDGGVYAPGNSPGISTAAAVDFDDTATIFGGPTLMIELAGIAPGTEYDQLHVTGSLSLGGTLAVSLLNGFAPEAGNSFDILDWGTTDGAFDTVNLPALSGTLTWDTSQLPTTGELIVIPEPGSTALLALGALTFAARRRAATETAG